MKTRYEKGICSECGNENWIKNKSKQLCNWCDHKIKAKKYAKKRKEKEKMGKKVNKSRLYYFFKKFWKKYSNHVCFETGEPLYKFRSWHLHHLLEKKDYPELAYKEDNIVYLTLEMHSLWHSLTDKQREKRMPKTYQQYLIIKNKYAEI